MNTTIEDPIGDSYKCNCTVVLWKDWNQCVPCGTLTTNHIVTVVDYFDILFKILSDVGSIGWVDSSYLTKIDT